MFKFLKKKLGNWAKKVSSKKEEEVEQKQKQEKEEKAVEKIKKEAVKKSKKKKVKKKASSKKEKPSPKEKKKPKEKDKKAEVEKKTKPKEPIEPGKKGFFKKIKDKIQKVKITEEDFEIYSEELEMLLLENNVALKVAEKIIKELKERIVGKELLKKEVEFEIKDAFKEIIKEILIEPFNLIEKIKEKSQKEKEPYVVLFCGVNGTGKTTTIAKIAQELKNQNLSCVFAAADTFRAASIEQIKKHGEKLNVKVIAHDYGSDPAAVAYDAIEYAKNNNINAVLIDTAGRMH
ncbi:signal recognition particle-docking protein FtsY, partial [Candidatus Pacearchaeota archaeon]|nr:signal recognition particle-docking protein FtsY [Candidatus Pacearchaeota archaeon]